jgi:hypothetical protein
MSWAKYSRHQCLLIYAKVDRIIITLTITLFEHLLGSVQPIFVVAIMLITAIQVASVTSVLARTIHTPAVIFTFNRQKVPQSTNILQQIAKNMILPLQNGVFTNDTWK